MFDKKLEEKVKVCLSASGSVKEPYMADSRRIAGEICFREFIDGVDKKQMNTGDGKKMYRYTFRDHTMTDFLIIPMGGPFDAGERKILAGRLPAIPDKGPLKLPLRYFDSPEPDPEKAMEKTLFRDLDVKGLEKRLSEALLKRRETRACWERQSGLRYKVAKLRMTGVEMATPAAVIPGAVKESRLDEDEAYIEKLAEKQFADVKSGRKKAMGSIARLLNKNLRSGNEVVLDTETTGFGAADEILQITMTDGDGKVLLDSLVKPEYRTSWPKAMETNHIRPEDVKDAPGLKELAPEIEKILSSANEVIGYNLGFDLRMLNQNGIRLPEKEKYTDLMVPFAEAYAKHEGSEKPRWKKLSDAASFYGIDSKSWHDSRSDTVATAAVYREMTASGHLGSRRRLPAANVANFRPRFRENTEEKDIVRLAAEDYMRAHGAIRMIECCRRNIDNGMKRAALHLAGSIRKDVTWNVVFTDRGGMLETGSSFRKPCDNITRRKMAIINMARLDRTQNGCDSVKLSNLLKETALTDMAGDEVRLRQKEKVAEVFLRRALGERWTDFQKEMDSVQERFRAVTDVGARGILTDNLIGDISSRIGNFCREKAVKKVRIRIRTSGKENSGAERL